MKNIGRKAAVATVAFAAVGSTLFGGVALANGKGDHKDKKDVEVTQTATASARGGDACNGGLIGAVPISVALLGTVDACNAGDAGAEAGNVLGG